MILPASYANGFAPRDGMPLYPELWRGCVFAAAPCLGPTGESIPDWSGFGVRGAITGPAYPVTAGQYAIGLSGSNQITLPNTVPSPTSELTLSLWCDPTNKTNTPFLVSRNVVLAFAAYGIAIGNSSTIFECRTATSQDLSSSLTVVPNGVMSHLAVRFKSGTVDFFLNGIKKDTKTASGATFASGGSGHFLGAFSAAAQKLTGRLDDIRQYNAAISDDLIKRLASRRGIAYELAPRRRSRAVVITSGFSALRPSILRGSR